MTTPTYNDIESPTFSQNTSPDLYSVLGLANKNATETEIKQAYKKCCFKYHPDKNIHNNQQHKATQMFQLITDAFLILSDANLRRKYDIYGMQGIKDFKDKESEESSCTKYDSKVVFDNFYNDSNSGIKFGNMGLYDLPDFKSRKEASGKTELQKMTETKVDPVYHDLPCTLEELFIGAEKEIYVTRRLYLADTKTFITESKTLRIRLEPDWKDGMQINMNNEGDHDEGKEPGDLIFNIREIPHEHFQRDDANNLIFHANITLCEALTDCIVKVTALSGKTLIIPCPEIIHQHYERRIQFEGMPHKDKCSKGDLIIRFNIVFPKVIKLEIKRQLHSLLSAV